MKEVSVALGRMVVAGLAGAAAAAGVSAALTPFLPRDWIGAALVVALASVADLVIYVAVMLLLGVEEVRLAIMANARSRRMPHNDNVI